MASEVWGSIFCMGKTVLALAEFLSGWCLGIGVVLGWSIHGLLSGHLLEATAFLFSSDSWGCKFLISSGAETAWLEHQAPYQGQVLLSPCNPMTASEDLDDPEGSGKHFQVWQPMFLPTKSDWYLLWLVKQLWWNCCTTQAMVFKALVFSVDSVSGDYFHVFSVFWKGNHKLVELLDLWPVLVLSLSVRSW